MHNFLFVASLLLCSVTVLVAKRYHAHDPVSVIVNTVGPFNNPTETYPYYSLPFCEGTGKQTKHFQNLGETLSGSHKVATPYEITFLDPVPWRSLCEDYLVVSDMQKLKDAVEDDFFFEFFIDDLPIWGYIGEVVHEEFLLGKSIQGARVYIYPHLAFTLGFNGDQIVTAKVSTDINHRIDITDIQDGVEVAFSYSVSWEHEPNIAYDKRMDRYTDHSTFLPKTFEIHWLSIVNSAVLVILLILVILVILVRILKNDFSRYLLVDDEDLAEDESGWKMIHGDVFRAPKWLSFFISINGAGAQLFSASIVVLLCVLLGSFRATKRGALLTVSILVYALCGFVGGFVSGRLSVQLKDTSPSYTSILTAVIFPLPLATVFAYVNSVAWSANSTAALPTTTILLICGILCFVHMPLLIFGSIVGKAMTGIYRSPCHTNKIAREIPPINEAYKHPIVQFIMAGFLPFSAIYIELHYIFEAMWGHQIYTLFGILFMTFVLLSLTTSCITVALAYFQLAREDYGWWWQSLINGGATGVFIFIYSFFYWYHRSDMDGLLQLSFYFGYSGLVAYAAFLMLGFVGFFSSFLFVEYIYGNVKTD